LSSIALLLVLVVAGCHQRGMPAPADVAAPPADAIKTPGLAKKGR
jgi:hypothetical protein